MTAKGDSFELTHSVLTHPGQKLEISLMRVKLMVEGKFTTGETPGSGLG